MSIIWQVKEGSNRILGSLLFFLSVVVLIYASENLKNFNLDSFDSIITLFTITSFLTILLSYLQAQEFIYNGIIWIIDKINSRSDLVNFRSVSNSIFIKESKNNVISLFILVLATFILEYSLFSSKKLVALLFSEGKLLEGISLTFVILIIAMLMVLLIIRLLFEIKQLYKEMWIVYHNFIIELKIDEKNKRLINDYLEKKNWTSAELYAKNEIRIIYSKSCHLKLLIDEISDIHNQIENKNINFKQYKTLKEKSNFSVFSEYFNSILNQSIGHCRDLIKLGINYYVVQSKDKNKDFWYITESLRLLGNDLEKYRKKVMALIDLLVPQTQNSYLKHWQTLFNSLDQADDFIKDLNTGEFSRYNNLLKLNYSYFVFFLFTDIFNNRKKIFQKELFLDLFHIFENNPENFNQYLLRHEQDNPVNHFLKYLINIESIDNIIEENLTNLQDKFKRSINYEILLKTVSFNEIENHLDDIFALILKITEINSPNGIHKILHRFENFYQKNVLIPFDIQTFIDKNWDQLKLKSEIEILKTIHESYQGNFISESLIHKLKIERSSNWMERLDNWVDQF